MCRFILKFTLGFIAVILGIVGIVLLTLRTQAFNADTYKSALSSTNLYDRAIDKVFSFAPSENESAKIFIDPILENLDEKTVLVKTVESNLDNVESWMNGKELFIYFPREDLLNAFDLNDIKENVFEEYDSEFAKLPTCSNEQLSELQNALQNKEIYLECKPNESDYPNYYNDLKSNLTAKLDEIFSSDNPIGLTLDEAGLGYLSENTKFEDVLNSQKDGFKDPKETLKSLDQVQRVFVISRIVAIGIIVLSVIFALFTALLAKNKFKFMAINFTNIYIIVGTILSVCALILKTFIPKFIDQIDVSKLAKEQEAIPFAQDALIAGEQIILNVVQSLLVISLIILAISFIIRIIAAFIKVKNPE